MGLSVIVTLEGQCCTPSRDCVGLYMHVVGYVCA